VQSLGHPIGVIDSFILESLGSGVRAALLMVPCALGAQEASFILLGALFGLPADTALADFLVEARPRAGLRAAGPAGLALGRSALSSASERAQILLKSSPTE